MNELNTKLKRAIKVNKWVDRLIVFLILIVAAFAFMFYMDLHRQLEKGYDYVKYIDFDELLKINPDTVAWITIDDTHIDHPVVKGKDNFEYLTKDFYGKYYAGGTIFLDCENKRDLSDGYNIIHGHHMTGGAMFGDLGNFRKKDCFDKHKTGKLLTPKYDYDLKILSVGIADAYDDRIYNVKVDNKIHIDEIKALTLHKRAEPEVTDKILVLSTCSGAMDNERTILVCTMINKRPHE